MQIEAKDRFTVDNACEWETQMEISIWELYEMEKRGEIGVNSDFLQRRVQTDEWTKEQCRRVKEWWSSVVRGNGKVDYIMLVPIDLIVKSLKIKLQVDSSERENIEPVLQQVQQDEKDGVLWYTVDGQNRIYKAIVPFFENVVPFGQKALTIYDKTKVGRDAKIKLNGKLFKEFDEPVQEFLKSLTIPLAIAVSGDIDSITDALIAKNTNVAWTSWQKLRTKNSFTDYNVQIQKVFEEDGLVADRVFSRLGGGYEYDTDGYEKFISEMLIWMDTQVQPNKSSNDEHEKYFKGVPGCIISENKIKTLKKYLREYAMGTVTITKNQHGVVRNYVMLRYAMDNSTKFHQLDLPKGWKILNLKEFVSTFQNISKALHDDPDAKVPYTVGGKKKSMRVAGYFPWACSEYSPDFLNCRLRLLSGALQDKTEKLIDDNTIVVTDTTPLPSQEHMWVKSPFDHKGNPISAIQIQKKEFHRGHKKAHADGGKNTLENLELQSVESNLSYGKETVEVDN